jgi:predicted Zn-dependent peptidase
MSVDRRALPAVGPDLPVKFPPVARGRLANGLGIWTVERREVPVVTFQVVVPAGSSTDPPDRPGLAALTADLLDEGSDDRDAIAMHEALARMGGHLAIDTGYDATVVTIVALSRYHGEALRLLADMVFRPRLAEADFERVRDLRCNRLAQLRDVPAALAERAFASHLFGPHPYGHLPIGTETALREATIADVRAFHARRYRPDGLLLIAVGDLSHDQVIGASAQAFDGSGESGQVRFDPLGPAPPTPPGRRLAIVDRPGAPQSELRVGHVSVARSTPDYHTLVVLNALLGGQFVSRINLKLREEKGYTYGARSAFDWRRGPGPFVVQTSVQTDATAAAVGDILAEMSAVAGDRPPTDREMTLARASLTRGYARNFETSEQVARGLVQLAVYELPMSWFDEFVSRVNVVEVDSTVRGASRHLHTADALVTIVGDQGKIERDLASLGFETILDSTV